MKDLAYLNKYFRKYSRRLLAGVFFVIASNLLSIYPAQIIRISIDLIKENLILYRLSAGFDSQTAHYKNIALLFGGILLSLALIKGIFMFFMRQTIIVVSRHIEYDLKNELYSHYQLLSQSFYKKNNTGDLMNRVTEDVGRVRMYLGPAVMYAINMVVLFVLIIITMFNINVRLSIYALLPLPFLAVAIYLVNETINKRSEQIQEQLSGLSTFVQETFSGIRILKAFVREKDRKRFFAEASTNYRTQSMGLVKVQAMFFPTMLILIGLSTLLTILIGGLEVINGTITTGNIGEFIVYVTLLTWPVTSLGWVTSLVQRAAASQKRINQFLNTKPEIVSGKTKINQLKGDIRFENVSFSYPGAGFEALKSVSFHVKPGETLGILGKTGSGKSTIGALLNRLYDADKGKIWIDEIDIKKYNLTDLRKNNGYVPQETFLFSDTISNNIAFGLPGASQNEIELAAKISDIHDSILSFPNEYATEVGERGITLSGGQKQRVSIARALIKKPIILCLDDCLSAVDTQTEERIFNSLSTEIKGKTTVIISHRISSLRNSTNILVLDDGEVMEYGNHLDLLLKKGLYSQFYEKQILEEESIDKPDNVILNKPEG